MYLATTAFIRSAVNIDPWPLQHCRSPCRSGGRKAVWSQLQLS
jgi:hypothetical protein